MLSVLKIQNIAIIESAEIEFSDGFNVLSGETGAGKSIILDSINAVLGFRTSRELIRTGETEAQVTALFSRIGENVKSKLAELDLPNSPDDTLLISRVISADKNVCKVNNSLTTVSVLRELGAELMSIHGQQDNRELLNSETHIGYIDALSDGDELICEFKNAYNEYCDIKSKIKKLSTDKEAKARKIDILSYQIDEIEKAEVHPGELDSLRARRNELQNFTRIQNSLSASYEALSGSDGFRGAVELVSNAYRELDSISSFSSDLGSVASKIADLYYELQDVAETVRDSVNEEGFSQAELDNIEDRIDLLNNLCKKYGETEEAILEFLDNARDELDNISVSDEKLIELKAKCKDAENRAMTLARKLSELRRKTAEKFSGSVCSELSYLDMPHIQFLVDFKEVELYENGIDSAEFLISANVGEIPKPLTKIASGGELSRVMLALKTIMANKDKISTMIFDEIDTGVSGHAATKVASKLKQVSEGKQVLCVTHLAQLMAFADSHYLIEKSARNEKTYTEVTLLDREGRKREIARITGGGKIEELQLKNAEEMLLSAQG